MNDPHPDLVVFDDFLDPALFDALLAHALAQADSNEPAVLSNAGVTLVDRKLRAAEICTAGLGDLHEPFVECVIARFDEMIATLGVRRFAVAHGEVELVAHNDGAFFSRHIDTDLEYTSAQKDTHRMISLVYYFHREPKGFEGGELEFQPVLGGEPQVIQPYNNRLVAFPSFLPHEVRPVSCPSGAFADSRFAVNMWLNRARRVG